MWPAAGLADSRRHARKRTHSGSCGWHLRRQQVYSGCWVYRRADRSMSWGSRCVNKGRKESMITASRQTMECCPGMPAAATMVGGSWAHEHAGSRVRGRAGLPSHSILPAAWSSSSSSLLLDRKPSEPPSLMSPPPSPPPCFSASSSAATSSGLAYRPT